jgi:hypothetical protein
MLRTSRENGLEGVVAKLLNSAYELGEAVAQSRRGPQGGVQSRTGWTT